MSTAFGWEPAPGANPNLNGWNHPSPRTRRSCLEALFGLLLVILAFSAGLGVGWLIWGKSTNPVQPAAPNAPADKQPRVEAGPGDGHADFLDRFEDCRILVDYSRRPVSWAGDYTKMDPLIKTAEATNKEKGKREVGFHLFHLTKERSTKSILELMDRCGYRPATLTELMHFCFGVQRGNQQILALGTRIENAHPMFNTADGRELQLCPALEEWNPFAGGGGGPYFLGVRK